jgi:hypothetical protein
MCARFRGRRLGHVHRHIQAPNSCSLHTTPFVRRSPPKPASFFLQPTDTVQQPQLCSPYGYYKPEVSLAVHRRLKVHTFAGAFQSYTLYCYSFLGSEVSAMSLRLHMRHVLTPYTIFRKIVASNFKQEVPDIPSSAFHGTAETWS